MNPRSRKTTLFTLVVLLVVGAAACKKDKGDTAQGGEVGEVAVTATTEQPGTPEEPISTETYRGWLVIQERYLPSSWSGGNSDHVQRIVYADTTRTGTDGAEWSGDLYYRFEVPEAPCQRSETAGHGSGKARIQVGTHVNTTDATQALPVPTEMLVFNLHTLSGELPHSGIQHLCQAPSHPTGGAESPTRTFDTGIAFPSAQFWNPPMTVSRSYTHTYQLREYQVTVCMSRSTVDTDDDGLPDEVDLAPEAAAPAVDLGVPGGPPTEVIPAQFGGPSGVEGVPACPAQPGQDETEDAECAKPEEDPVVCYAPVVRLHPDEITFPMDIADFVEHSRLMWNRDHGCDDEVVAEDVDVGRIGKEAKSPYTAQEAGWPGCDPSGHRFAASDLTKPGQEDKEHGLDQEEGFYLDLDDDRRLGAVPDTPGGDVEAVAYYSSSTDRRKITYWFMYGFNQGAPGAGTLVDHHEGEWERITVLLRPDGSASAVQYWQHECATPETLGYRSVELVGTHPVVYAALGSHASFPDIREVTRDGLCEVPGIAGAVAGQGWGDKTVAGGSEWKTWATGLLDAADQPWYGFGGAWGEIGGREKSGDACARAEDVTSGDAPCLVDVTGPLGPDHKNLFAYP